MNNILMVSFSYYPADPRIRREAEALLSIADNLLLICLRNKGEKRTEIINGVKVRRVSVERKRNNKFRYIFQYMCFFFITFFILNYHHIVQRIKMVHIHNMPDFLVFTALIPKFTGSKIVLDLHDPMPEVYMAKYDLSDTKPLIKLLIFLERASIKFSDIVLTPNSAFKELFISRGCPQNKINVVMNSPQEDIFSCNDAPAIVIPEDHKSQFIIMYHGSIVERHGLDTALRAIGLLKNKIPNIIFNVYGEGEYLDHFLKLVNDMGLKNFVNYMGFQDLYTIAQAIEKIDVGIIPNKRNPFTEINLPTRIFEYLCKNKPVIAPFTTGISDYFGKDSICYFEPEDSKSLASAILRVYLGGPEIKRILENGRKVYHKYTWVNQKIEFLQLIRDNVLCHSK